jgi:O-antigen/teichoic acid export membrane protein
MSKVSEKKTLLELIAGGGRQVAATLTSLVVYTVVARTLKAEKLGAWSLLGTVSFLLTVTDLGLTTAVQRAAVAGDEVRARRAVALTLVPLATLGPVVAVASYTLLLGIHSASPEVQRDVSRAAVVVLLAGVVSSLGAPYRGFAYARGRGNALAAARTVQALVHLVTVVCGFSWVGHTLAVPATGFLLGAVVELGITLGVARAIDPLLPLAPALPLAFQETRAAVGQGAATLVINLSMVLAVRMDAIILSRVAPLALIGAYSVAARTVDMGYSLAKQATVVLQPRLGDPSQRESAVRLGTAVFCGAIATGMAAIALDAQPLLVAWVGPVADGGVTATVLALLALGAVVLSTEELAGSMLTLSGRTAWATAVPAAIGSLVNVTISVLGSPRYGIWAVAGSTVVGGVVMTLLVWINARRVLGYGFAQIGRAFAPPLTSGLVSLAVAWALRGFARTHALASLASCAVAMGAGALVGTLLFWQLSLRASPPETPVEAS